MEKLWVIYWDGPPYWDHSNYRGRATSLKAAKEIAERALQQEPRKSFIIFEAVEWCETTTVQWHKIKREER